MSWKSFNFDVLRDLNFDDLRVHLVTWESVISLTWEYWRNSFKVLKKKIDLEVHEIYDLGVC